MTLLHGTVSGLDSALSFDLGTFKAPPSTFNQKNTDGTAVAVEEAVQNETALFPDEGYNSYESHNVIFAHAGPVGGRCRVTVFNWDRNGENTGKLGSLETFYEDEALGGNANVAGMFPFVENISNSMTGGSGSGCNAGTALYGLALVGMLILKKRS